MAHSLDDGVKAQSGTLLQIVLLLGSDITRFVGAIISTRPLILPMATASTCHIWATVTIYDTHLNEGTVGSFDVNRVERVSSVIFVILERILLTYNTTISVITLHGRHGHRHSGSSALEHAHDPILRQGGHFLTTYTQTSTPSNSYHHTLGTRTTSLLLYLSWQTPQL